MKQGETLPPEQLADLAKMQANDAATRRANSEPLPGPLSQAYTVEELKVLGITLRPVVAGDFILLKKLNSPLYRRTFELAEHQRKIMAGDLEKDAAPPVTQYDDEECVEMVYQFAVPLPQARADLKKGRDHFREQAQVKLTDRLPVDALPKLVEAVVLNFTAAFSTAVKYEGEKKEGGDEEVFTVPAGAGATASAGGLITSPGSVAAIPPGNHS